MGLTYQGEQPEPEPDKAGPYAHGPRMWRLYDAMWHCIREEEWETIAPVVSELSGVIQSHGWVRSCPHSVGEIVIERVPVAVRSVLGDYNRAVGVAQVRAKAPKHAGT